MTTNYAKGRAREYRTKKKLESQGYIVIRSAGSHSPIDLVAIHPEFKQIVFIQCKPRKFSKKEEQRLRENFFWLNSLFKVRFEVVTILQEDFK